MTPPNICDDSDLTKHTSGEPIQIIKSKQEYQQSEPSNRIKHLQFKTQVVWRNVVIFFIIHSVAVYGLWLFLSGQYMWRTFFFSVIWLYAGTLGVTGGAHRLWAHRTYKAKLPFRIWLMLWQTASLQNSIYEWVRDHRVHHKFVDTDADPHNSNRGFFFCHMGWLMMKKHRDVIAKGKTVDMSDLEADPVVRWQKKYYIPMVILLTFFLPTIIPVYFWGEKLKIAFICGMARFVIQLNGTWLVNSAAHMWGYRPYDKFMNARENFFVSFIGAGEGWHNYHHTFPWDYKAAELGNYRYNLTTAMLDFMAYIGQVSDLKTVSEDMIRRRAARTGDGTRRDTTAKKVGDGSLEEDQHNQQEEWVWGWGDKDMTEEDIKEAKIYNSLKDD